MNDISNLLLDRVVRRSEFLSFAEEQILTVAFECDFAIISVNARELLFGSSVTNYNEFDVAVIFSTNYFSVISIQ